MCGLPPTINMLQSQTQVCSPSLEQGSVAVTCVSLCDLVIETVVVYCESVRFKI